MNDLWDGIIGQNSVKGILEKILFSETKPQALIFSGFDGTGKDYLAVRFAHLLNNLYFQNYPVEDFNNFNSPFIKFIFATPRGKNETASDGPLDKISSSDYQEIITEVEKKSLNPYYNMNIEKANEIRISSIRELNKYLSLNNVEKRKRIVIISHADMMNDESQNALLKNLEEPPNDTLFILTTSKLNLLKETIRSRCWLVDFEPLSNSEIEQILIEYFKFNEEKAIEVSSLSFGSISLAINLISYDLKYLKEKTIIFLRFAMAGNFYTALNQISEIKNIEPVQIVKIILTLISAWLNDVIKNRSEINNYYFNEYEETLIKFNKKFSNVELTKIINYFDKLNNSIDYIKLNSNILLLNILYRIYSIINLENYYN